MNNTLKLSVMMLGLLLTLSVPLYLAVRGGNQETVETGVADEPGSRTQGQDNEDDEQEIALATLAKTCASSVGPDGFGTVSINRPSVVEESRGEIGVPCNIKLGPGGSLAFEEVELRSQSLSISDQGPNGKSKVRIAGSSFTGKAGSGFFAQLSDREDSVVISGSTLDYPLSLWVRAVGVADGAEGGGRVHATASTLRSTDPKGDGIQLVAHTGDGVGHFVKLKLEAPRLSPNLKPNAKNILLLAGKCRMQNIQGYAGTCGSK